jgi:hypothetical protein
MPTTLNTMTRPWWNGCEIRVGKKSRPVRALTFDAGNVLSAPLGASRCLIGLTSRNDENRVAKGGRWATCCATLADTPCSCSPLVKACGSVPASPAIMSEKKARLPTHI